jgi:ribosomal-protein-alanine N-acetyltransferase
MSYHIRSVGRAYTENLSELHHACFARGWSHLEFEGFFDRAGVFAAIAYHNMLPVGFVVCWVIEDECDLLSMGVLPDYRRDGVGLMLLEHCMETAKHMGAKNLVLEVNAQNSVAQTLYEAQGFEAFSTRKDYYSDAEGNKSDAICMRKEI